MHVVGSGRRGELREGATLYWAFNPIRPRYLYKMPAMARIAEYEVGRRVAWEVSTPGFHALHRYSIEPVEGDRCRFGSWEVAERSHVPGPAPFLAGPLPVRLPGFARGRPNLAD